HRYCEVGETVDFGATVTDADGDPTTSEWSFGDGGEETGTTASHAWTMPGDYAVEFEVTDGMHETTAIVDVTVAKPLVVLKVKGGVSFKKELKDKLKLKATLDLPADFVPEGQMLTVAVGDVESMFLLDAKGKGKSIAGSVKLKYSKKAGTWVVSAKLKKGEFAETWADHGVVNETVKAVALSLPARVRVGESTFIVDAPALYTGKEGKSGKFKTPRR
ncbi:MAG: PKD domain-containing protein, partial [Planctomycetota bacterium]